MRIGVDASCWANDRGYGRFARELCAALVRQAPDDDFVFFLDPASRARFALNGTNIRTFDVEQRVPPSKAAAADGSRSVGDLFRFTLAVWRESPDVFFSPSVYTFFPLPPRQKSVVGIHDTIAERFPELTLPSRRARMFWRAKVNAALFQSTLILTVSDYAADEIVEVLGVRRNRIRVATEAPAVAFTIDPDEGAVDSVARRLDLSRDTGWFVYVGGFNPHKNVDVLVEAFAAATEDLAPGGRPVLVLVGKTDGDVFHGNVEDIKAAIKDAGVSDCVRWAGFLEDELLRDLHSGALGLILPSESEGFGLPAVEAAAGGCPVIATTMSPLPDLLEGGGAFVRPGDREKLSAAIRTFMENPSRRAEMGRTARKRARALSWDACARTTLSALREAAQ